MLPHAIPREVALAGRGRRRERLVVDVSEGSGNPGFLTRQLSKMETTVLAEQPDPKE